ncbi:glial cell line-derived neurotrophic factor-like [Pungitius pungitius]|uniref:glial cell line-derived neurotrophic factor-like n=1 Tax=Pungitius pungitius TaxID=134920 RepID=UPI002E0DACC4
MKLWGSLTTCLTLLSAVRAGRPQPASTESNGRAPESPLELPPVQVRFSVTSPSVRRAEAAAAGWRDTLAAGEASPTEEPTPNEFEDMVDFIKVTISRMRRSPSSTTSSPSQEGWSSRTQNRRGRKKGATRQRGGRRGRARDGGAGRKAGGGGRGCALKQIHLNVTDLGLGYRSSEEMIFRYCSGPCRKSETNYDKILHNLAHNKRLPPKDTPPQACCRPTAFDDDLSFLDDNLVYHTVRKHSARRCGCV